MNFRLELADMHFTVHYVEWNTAAFLRELPDQCPGKSDTATNVIKMCPLFLPDKSEEINSISWIWRIISGWFMLSFPPPFSRNESSATVAQTWHQLHEVPYRRVPEILPAMGWNMYFRQDMTEQQVYLQRKLSDITDSQNIFHFTPNVETMFHF